MRTRAHTIAMIAAVCTSAAARAAPGDAIAAKLKQCTPNAVTNTPKLDELLAATGAITEVAAVGAKPVARAALVTGKTGKAYVFIADDHCSVVPIAGRAAAYAKGNFGGGAAVAYAVQPPSCNAMDCPTVVSIKTADDKLVDAVDVGPCVAGAELRKVSLRTGRDSLVLGCWNAGGADRDRTDDVIDNAAGGLAVVFSQAIGIAWVQVDESGPHCAARPPGGIAIVSAGDAPVIDVSRQVAADEAAADHVDWLGAGCEQSSKTVRYRFDPATQKFVVAGKPRYSVAKALCDCKK